MILPKIIHNIYESSLIFAEYEDMICITLVFQFGMAVLKANRTNVSISISTQNTPSTTYISSIITCLWWRSPFDDTSFLPHHFM